MPLFDFECQDCHHHFEQMADSRREQDPEAGVCPRCQGKNARRLISRFRIGGQGDLRESTLHGCHDHFDGLPHSHDHHHEESEA